MFVIIDDDTTAVNLTHVSYVEKRDDRAAVIHFVQQSPPLAIVGAAAVKELFSKLAAVASPVGVIIDNDNGQQQI